MESMKKWADGPSRGWKDEWVGDNAGDLGGEGKSAHWLLTREIKEKLGSPLRLRTQLRLEKTVTNPVVARPRTRYL